MSTLEIIQDETRRLPPDFQEEVLDFVRYLKLKLIGKINDGLMMSYEALAESWLSPEDEEAWKDL